MGTRVALLASVALAGGAAAGIAVSASLLGGTASPAALALTGATSLVCVAFACLVVGRHDAARLAAISRLLDRTMDGDHGDRLEVGIRDDIGVLAAQVNQLVSSASARERRLLESALVDPLTGLANRTLLTDRIAQMIAVAHRARSAFAVAVLDLDRFKFVNDSLGHAAGDRLLREVASRLKKAIREGDTVARLGGDEFVLLIGGDASVAGHVADRVLDAMREPARHHDQLIDINLSIGIALYPAHGQDDVTLLRHADAAMYRAKRSRAGKQFFDGEAGEVRRSYLSMLGEMRSALEKSQFLLEYQPKLDLRSALIVGVEGLVRWRHPERGMVPPGEFIPFAEQTGFMREITRWVVAEGARFAAALHASGISLTVSVNVSAQDIENPDFSAAVAQTIAAATFPPDKLCLEITESGVVSESETALRNLRAIAGLGVRISVDDFGTGYATLKQLQQLPVNELKIDRSFVSGMQVNRGNQTIVRSTIELAKQLGLSVVAEGVETVVELRGLAAMGCDQVQGYYVAKPMPAEEVASWVQMRHSLHASSREDYYRMLTAAA